MNAKSHITTFKWRHINAFPVHLSSNNSLEQCAVHAHEIVFFSREAWTVLPWRAFWIGVLNQRFKTLILPSQNKHERSLGDDFFPPWTYDMNIHDLRLQNKSTHVRGLVILLHTTKFTCNEWRPPTACHTNIVLCSHSEALVIDPEQLRWLEVS